MTPVAPPTTLAASEHGVDLDERVRMNLRVGVDEGEDLAASDARAAVARRRDDAFLDADHATAACRGHARRVIRRLIVRDDHLDVARRRVDTPRNVDRVEEPRQQALLVVGRDDQRVTGARIHFGRPVDQRASPEATRGQAAVISA